MNKSVNASLTFDEIIRRALKVKPSPKPKKASQKRG
jgi:hypothetical protein